MPKKLNIEPNQRIDLPDYLRGANDYTAEMEAFSNEKLLMSRFPTFVDSFRVQIANQTLNPGQITVYNGVALDRSGKVLNNEDAVNDSRTVTLAGSSTTFYVEIEFTETESDSDARGFLDPTYVNPAPIPPGREISLNTSTRITPDWRIVTPVSTTGFERTTNKNSNKIPLIVLETDASNQINTSGGNNPGLVQVAPSTTLEESVVAGATSLKVIDSALFPSSGSLTVDFGGVDVETVTITANDTVHGILTVTPVGFNHAAGAIIRPSGVATNFVRQRTSAKPDASTHPDYSVRLFSGDEVRGSALISSKETFGSRDDTAIKSLKDSIDAMSAKLHELSWGNVSYGDDKRPPVSGFSTAKRWYDYSGGVVGAKGVTVTIGDGVNSFGDYNNAELSDTLLEAVFAATLANGAGTVLIKKGVYTFTSTTSGASLTGDIRIVGEPGTEISCDFTGSLATPPVLFSQGSGNLLVLENLEILDAGSVPFNVLETSTATEVRILNCDLRGGIDVTTSNCDVMIDNTTIQTTSGTYKTLETTTGARIVINNSRLVGSGASSTDVLYNLTSVDSITCTNTSFEAGGSAAAACIVVGNRGSFTNCRFTNTSSSAQLVYAEALSSSSQGFVFSGCAFSGTFSAPLTAVSVNSDTLAVFTGCTFSSFSFSATNSSSNGVLLGATSASTKAAADKCQFIGTSAQYLVAVRNFAFVLNSNITGGFYIGVESPIVVQNNNFALSSSVALRCVSKTTLTATTGQLFVSKNKFVISDALTNADVSHVYISAGAGGSNAVYAVADNFFSTIAATGTGSARFLHIVATSGGRGTVTGNSFNLPTASAVVTSGVFYGVHLDASTSSRLVFTGNSLLVGGLANTGARVGVYLVNARSSVIEGNDLSFTVTNAGPFSAFHLTGPSTNNLSVVSDNTISFTGTSNDGYGMYLDSCAFITVRGNNIVGGSGSGAGIHILGASIRSYKISDNHVIDCSTIGISGSFGGDDISVDNNTIYLNGTATCTGIQLVALSGIRLLSASNNKVFEPTFNTGNNGIVVTGSSGDYIRGANVSNNTVSGGQSTTNRGAGSFGIDLRYIEALNSNNNNVKWVNSGVMGGSQNDGPSIRIRDFEFAVVNNNLTVPGNASGFNTVEIIGRSAVIDGNIVGGAGQAGTLFLSDLGVSSLISTDNKTNSN